ncbi:putative lipid II flippase FtsW [Bengtsoniella intestinalis]|uniref:putative lipid II flippase FtsW n=1 Tax=Bengtsoniella intestinalis TaxID=3073143 RepID=UPI00391FC663
MAVSEFQKRQDERNKAREAARQERQEEKEKLQRIRERQEQMRELAHGPVDTPFFVLVCLLSAIGLIMLFSASFPSSYYESGNPFSYVIRQAAFMALGFAGMLFLGKMNYLRYRAVSRLAMLAAVVLLILVIVPGVGITANNATRWLGVPGTELQFQPSELAKLAVVLYFADSISKKREQMRTLRHGILPYVFWLGIIAGLMWMQPHLSGMVLIVATGGIMMLVGGIHWLWLAVGAGGVVAAGYVIFEVIGYNVSRLEMWKNPWLDYYGDGYQLVQSYLAIGSGGLLGVGLGKSRQKYLYLPEEHNDFIFAIVCEELGLIGATIIMILFAALILRGYWIALHARDRFGSLLVVGVVTLIGLQIFLNIAVVSGLVPTTGISLPFFSYGGSALTIQLASMGFVLSVSRQMKPTKSG